MNERIGTYTYAFAPLPGDPVGNHEAWEHDDGDYITFTVLRRDLGQGVVFKPRRMVDAELEMALDYEFDDHKFESCRNFVRLQPDFRAAQMQQLLEAAENVVPDPAAAVRAWWEEAEA